MHRYFWIPDLIPPFYFGFYLMILVGVFCQYMMFVRYNHYRIVVIFECEFINTIRQTKELSI